MITILEIAQIASAPFIIGIIHFSLRAIGNKSSIDNRLFDTEEKRKEYIEYKKILATYLFVF